MNITTSAGEQLWSSDANDIVQLAPYIVHVGISKAGVFSIVSSYI